MSVRSDLAEMLTAEWAVIPELADVRVIATENPLDDVTTPTAVIRINSVQRHASAPLGAYLHGLTLTLISQHFDADAAADELEELLEAVLDYLRPLTFVHYEAAEFGLATEQNLGYAIPLTVTAVKAPELPEEV